MEKKKPEPKVEPKPSKKPSKPKIFEPEEMELIRTYQMESRTPLNELDDIPLEERMDRIKPKPINQQNHKKITRSHAKRT